MPDPIQETQEACPACGTTIDKDSGMYSAVYQGKVHAACYAAKEPERSCAY